MKLIVGLGNPEKKHQGTRHNIGFVIVDLLHASISNSGIRISDWEMSKKAKALYAKTRIKVETVKLLKPQTFMNDSGISVSYAKNKHKINPSDIYVVHDDLDIMLGKYKIQKGKEPKEHNGLKSIYESIGTKDYWHVRVGIENRSKITSTKSQTTNKLQSPNSNKINRNKILGEQYVLQRFDRDELATIEKVVDEVVESLLKTINSF